MDINYFRLLILSQKENGTLKAVPFFDMFYSLFILAGGAPVGRPTTLSTGSENAIP